MNTEEKLKIIKEVAEEIISEDELKKLFEEKKNPVAYDGFEPSGKIHIAQGLLRAINVNKLTSTGIKFKFYVADWFAMLNNKMGGDIEKIRIVGKYFVEVWKACGMDMKNVEFIWASDLIKDPEYWETVLKLSTNSTITRVLRCGQIMGREESTSNPASQILYPLMQAADIHHLGADIAQLGMDQRKVNMLARDIFPKLGLNAPIAIHHHMLMGLTEPDKTEEAEVIQEKIDLLETKKIEGVEIEFKEIKTPQKVERGFLSIINPGADEPIPKKSISILVNGTKESLEDGDWKKINNVGIRLDGIDYNKAYIKVSIKKEKNSIDKAIAKKMSKSNPASAIFMTDTEEDVNKKFKKAYCPEGELKDNPVLEYCKYIIFEKMNEFQIKRPEKFGGNVSFVSYEDLEKAFAKKEIHPLDLKTATAKYINELLKPIRDHFENNKEAKKLLEQVNSF